MEPPVNVDFVVAPIDTQLDELAGILNLVTHSAGGPPADLYLRGEEIMIDIGELVVHDGTIHIFPIRGTGECHRRYLLGAAEAAFFGTCHQDLGWKLMDDGVDTWWSTWISIPAAMDLTPREVRGPVYLGVPGL